MDRQVIWTAENGTTLEHLQVAREGLGWFADGIVCGMHAGRPLRCHYSVSCDREWRVRQVSMELPGRAPLRLRADGQGNWETALSEPLLDLAGCLDVDIAVTPFTNSLPIRRLGLAADSTETLGVVYIDPTELTPVRAEQRYTCLSREDEPSHAGTYRYEGLSSDFSAELAVDADGLVLDYPGLFQRLYPSDAHPAVETARPVPDRIPGYGDKAKSEDETD